MQKTITYILFILTILFLSLSGFAQITQDTAIVVNEDTANITINDSVNISIADSVSIIQDSTNIDSLKSKWNFNTVGGNDSTYYSFYGDIINADDTILIERWIYNLNVHNLDIRIYDSTLQDFHIFNPAFKKTINNGFLGNTGLAVNSNIFAEPNPQTEFIFMQSFTPYMFLSNHVDYYNVMKPFTIFRVDMGPDEEMNLGVLHTQNINKYFNVFIAFKNYTGEGKYIRQKVRDNAGTIGTSYTKGRLATHFNLTFNKIDAQENGGIIDYYMITDTTISTNDINTRLTNGSTYIKDRQMFFDQKIGFFKTNVPDSARFGNYWFSFQYTYNRHKSAKIYKDDDDTYINYAGDTLHLYQHTYNGTSTFDSVFYKHTNHNFRINLEENPLSYPFVGAYFGYGMQNTDYYYFNKDSLFNNSHSNTINSSYFEAGLYRLKGKKFKFQVNYKIFISGYRQADMRLNGFISQKFRKEKKQFEVKGYGGIFVKTPDYLLTDYYSNHYRWKNSFNSQKKTSINLKITYPYYRTEFGSRFNILSDFIYFDQDALPQQYNNAFTVFDIYLNNIFEFGRFGLRTRVNYQVTSNSSILPLPNFSGYGAFYYNPNGYFKQTGGHFRLHFGIDAYYWTEYYGQAYSPALATFYNQTEQTVGNYPFFGFFADFEIKRLRFYLRYEHANYGLTKPSNYFFTPYYPTNRGTFRYGLVWTFYD